MKRIMFLICAGFLLVSCETITERVLNSVDDEIKGKPKQTIDSLETVIDSLEWELRHCKRGG